MTGHATSMSLSSCETLPPLRVVRRNLQADSKVWFHALCVFPAYWEISNLDDMGVHEVRGRRRSSLVYVKQVTKLCYLLHMKSFYDISFHRSRGNWIWQTEDAVDSVSSLFQCLLHVEITKINKSNTLCITPMYICTKNENH